MISCAAEDAGRAPNAAVIKGRVECRPIRPSRSSPGSLILDKLVPYLACERLNLVVSQFTRRCTEGLNPPSAYRLCLVRRGLIMG